MPILKRRLFTLPDQVARERSHLWEDGVMTDTSTIFGTNSSDHEGKFYQVTAVDRNKFAVRELPKAENVSMRNWSFTHWRPRSGQGILYVGAVRIC